MDPWKYYGVTHADHGLMNPLSEETLARVLDVAAPRGHDARVVGSQPVVVVDGDGATTYAKPK